MHKLGQKINIKVTVKVVFWITLYIVITTVYLNTLCTEPLTPTPKRFTELSMIAT